MTARIHQDWILPAIVVAVALGLAFASSVNDAPIVDEVPHIGAGYSYVAKRDMRLNPEHPPLVKDLAGLGLLPLDISDNIFLLSAWTKEANGQWVFGRNLIFNGGVDADRIKTYARLPMLLLLALTCWLVWKWSAERYGRRAALLATVLIAFSPTVLAHGRFVTTDLAAALGVLAATYCFIAYLREHSTKNFIWAALTLGLALLAKFNLALLGPYFIAIAILVGLDGNLRRWRHAARLVLRTALIGITALVLVVWPVYLVHTSGYPLARQAADTRSLIGGAPAGALRTVALWASDKPVIRALGHWTLGLAMVQGRAQGGNRIYYLGRVVNEGGLGYFPTVWFLKEPLAWWMLVAVALTALAFHRRRSVHEKKRPSFWRRAEPEWEWLLWIALYLGVSMASTLNIGVRHLLPIYPFAVMLVAGQVDTLLAWLHTHDRTRYRGFAIGISLLVAWYVFEAVRVFPSFLTYFNQLAGGPTGGYRYVVDSNLDWGQDLKRLAQFAEDRNLPALHLDYFGWSDPAWYLKGKYLWTNAGQWHGRDDFARRNRSDGWIAVSGTFLQNSNGERTLAQDVGTPSYRWLMDEKPVAVIGNSIFVYRIE